MLKGKDGDPFLYLGFEHLQCCFVNWPGEGRRVQLSLCEKLISISRRSCYDVPGLTAPITRTSNPAGSHALADATALHDF